MQLPAVGGRAAESGRLVAVALGRAWRERPDGDLVTRRAAAAAAAPLLLRSGTAPLAWHALGAAAGPGLEEVHAASRLEALRTRLRLRSVGRVVSRLREAGVEPIVGKGWAIAREYPSPALRPFGDVDVYVSRRDAQRIRARGGDPEIPGADIHLGLSLLGDRDESEILRRTLGATLGRASVRVFGPEDHLRLLALHFLAHGAWRPLWLCDVALALERRPPGFDWGWFLSGEGWRTGAASLALAAAHELLGASFEGVPDAARRRPPRWLLASILRQWGRPGFVAQGQRRPFGETRGLRDRVGALRERWPDAVEATYGVGGSFHLGPRWVYQVAESVRRASRYARSRRGPLRRGDHG